MMPEGENVRRAIRWISSYLSNESHPGLWELINQATTKFDLNPMQAERMIHFFICSDHFDHFVCD